VCFALLAGAVLVVVGTLSEVIRDIRARQSAVTIGTTLRDRICPGTGI
jgi:hypothetical protein